MDSYAKKTVDEVVEEITSLHKSLPPRPALDDVEAATILVRNADNEAHARFQTIQNLKKRKHIPDELFNVLVEMQKQLVEFQTKEQKTEALRLLEVEKYHRMFDDMIQTASRCCNSVTSSVSSPPMTPASVGLSTPSSSSSSSSSSQMVTRDDSYVKSSKSRFYGGVIGDSGLNAAVTSGSDGGKLSLIKLASLIEVSSKKGAKDLDLHNKLMDQIVWLPDSLGKLSGLVTLDLSENRLLALPRAIGSLSSLTNLKLNSNKITEVPESIGDLLNLTHLNLRGNQLKSLPASLGKLVRLQELDLSSNSLSVLPDTIGSLVSLKKLNVETNNIEEIPHAIGQCSSLNELIADYNKLKALPEAVGRIESLEKLNVRYNNISRLPTTMSSLKKLQQLDVSFNELESVPESLCFATTLIKMDISNNFADLTSLPRSIGNLEHLEELNMSNNQIRVLPSSFRMLSKLRTLNVEGNPLELPPRNVLDRGAQAVVQYMNDVHEKKDLNLKVQIVKHKKSWTRVLFFWRSNKQKRPGLGLVAA